MRKTKGTADEIDKHVGLRIRNRRVLMGLSQEKLADAVGVTFQQVQKYERGTNRVSASRLYTFSKILGVKIDFFYSGLEHEETQTEIPENVLTDKETLNLIRAYYAVRDKLKRRKLMSMITFVSDIAGEPDVQTVA